MIDGELMCPDVIRRSIANSAAPLRYYMRLPLWTEQNTPNGFHVLNIGGIVHYYAPFFPFDLARDECASHLVWHRFYQGKGQDYEFEGLLIVDQDAWRTAANVRIASAPIADDWIAQQPTNPRGNDADPNGGRRPSNGEGWSMHSLNENDPARNGDIRQLLRISGRNHHLGVEKIKAVEEKIVKLENNINTKLSTMARGLTELSEMVDAKPIDFIEQPAPPPPARRTRRIGINFA